MTVPNNFILENASGLKNLIIRTFIWSIFAMFCMEFTNLVVAEEIAVVVNINNTVKSLTSREVSDIFLARRKIFPSSGEVVFVVEQPQNSKLREEFFRLLNRMKLNQVNAYWARLQFSGDVQPPKALSNSQSVIKFIKNNRYAIGYIDAGSVDASVHVILNLKD